MLANFNFEEFRTEAIGRGSRDYVESRVQKIYEKLIERGPIINIGFRVYDIQWNWATFKWNRVNVCHSRYVTCCSSYRIEWAEWTWSTLDFLKCKGLDALVLSAIRSKAGLIHFRNQTQFSNMDVQTHKWVHFRSSEIGPGLKWRTSASKPLH